MEILGFCPSVCFMWMREGFSTRIGEFKCQIEKNKKILSFSVSKKPATDVSMALKAQLTGQTLAEYWEPIYLEAVYTH